MSKKIDFKSIILGIILNILVVIVFILLYHAYIVSPKIDAPNSGQLEINEEI